MVPASWESANPNLVGADGIGRYYSGGQGTGGAVIRGGRWQNMTIAGIYAMTLQESGLAGNAFFGFRCVYRPYGYNPL